MLRKALYPGLAVILSISFLAAGCGSGEAGSNDAGLNTEASPRGTVGTMETEDAVVLTGGAVGVTGGTIKVSESDTPLSGMVINVPPNSYTAAREFELSYAIVAGHSFGNAFNPLTPLITVDNGGAYSAELMTVKIPVTVPADNFAMGFIYNDDGTLEGLPTVAQDKTSITVATRHFSDIIISSISDALLKKDIDSGFRPGIDDWQFTNRGSYISRGGQCAGQTMTALWYYDNQPDGAGYALYGRYDNNGEKPATPGLWQDDSLGYRFASVIQEDINWGSLGNRLMKGLGGVSDELTWKLFAYSMQLTGEPQQTAIFSSAGGGHAIVVYRVNDGNLYIADPNYPGNTERRIAYSGGKFTPYESGADAEAIAAGFSKKYETIEYLAKTMVIDWDKIGARWAEVKNKTIGNGQFPAYTISYFDSDNKLQELKDGFLAPKKDLKLGLDGGSVTNMSADAYRDGKKLAMNSGEVELKPGNNRLGFYIYAAFTETDKSGNPIAVKKYIDFKYINVQYNPLTIEPAVVNGEPGKTYTFTAMKDPLPDSPKYQWWVSHIEQQGDTITNESIQKQESAESTLAATFPTEGKYSVNVILWDSKENYLGSAESVITIGAAETSAGADSILPQLQKMTYLSGNSGEAKCLYELYVGGVGTSTEEGYGGLDITPYEGPLRITWNGASFSGKVTYNRSGVPATIEVSGKLSADGRTLQSFSYKFSQELEGALLVNRSFAFQNAQVSLKGDTNFAVATGKTPPTIVDIDESWDQNGNVISKKEFQSLEWLPDSENFLQFSVNAY